jgi:hypothetical protein
MRSAEQALSLTQGCMAAADKITNESATDDKSYSVSYRHNCSFDTYLDLDPHELARGDLNGEI